MRLIFFIAIAVLPLATFGQIPFSLQDRPFITKTSPLLNSVNGYWQMEESSGTRYDKSQFGNHLTDSASVGQATGKVGFGADFELSSSQSLVVADNPSVSLGSNTDFTWAFWIKPESLSANAILISKRIGINQQTEYQVTLLSSGPAIQLTIGNNVTFTNLIFGTAVPAVGSWTFVACWYSSADQKIYASVNDGSVSSLDWTGGTQNTSSDLRFGRSANTVASFYDGVMDEVYFAKRVLSAGEITRLYNNGNGTTYPRYQASIDEPFSISETSAYSWWIHPLSIVHNGASLISYVDNNGGQNIALTTSTGDLTNNIELSRGYVKDDHSASSVCRLGNGNLLYAWTNHNLSPQLYYRVANSNNPVSGAVIFLSASGISTYSQVLTNFNDAFWFYRVTNRTWKVRHTTDNATTWSVERNFIGDAITDQLYMMARNIGNSTSRCVVISHATATNNAIRIVQINMNSGLVSTGGANLGYLDGTSADGNTLPAARTNLSAIVSVAGDERLRLLDVKGDGSAFAYCHLESDNDPSDYKLARLTGADPYTAGDWTISQISATGTPFYPDGHYVGGVVFANEPHSGLRLYVSRETGGAWKIERFDSALGDGSDFVATELASSSDFLLRPVSPVGATSSLPVYWQAGSDYTHYLDYDLSISLF